MASNHSSFEGFDKIDPFKNNTKSMEAPRLLSEILGATGKYPNGKITDSDEGEMQFAITKKDETIIMEFGKPIHWMGFTPQQAIEVAKSLCKHAGVPMTIEIPD